MKDLKEFRGMFFDEETPDKVMSVICDNLGRENRLRFWWGNIETGKSWNEENDTCGYIGRSTGTRKIPLLIHNINSTGGGSILTDCVIKIVETRTKRVLYQHPGFNQPVFVVDFVNEVFAEGQIYGRCKNENQAQRLADFMNGKRMTK